ncbi:hypothetical protein [Nocardia acidivorans]|uniref:hypothetical protein n=1 Tax=Nocardia acidivorans TaxID=404580 RepID=UPI00082CEF89|nr:hypothetical protein [Nocardia acidivorans]
MPPTSANGQPAAAAYLRTIDGEYAAFGLAVPTLEAEALHRISVFADPTLVRRRGQPAAPVS